MKKKSVTDLEGLTSYTEHLNQGGFPTPSATLVANRSTFGLSQSLPVAPFCVPPGGSVLPRNLNSQSLGSQEWGDTKPQKELTSHTDSEFNELILGLERMGRLEEKEY